VSSPDPAPIPSGLDEASALWLTELRAAGPVRDGALERLHALLLRVTRAEAYRRRGSLPGELAGDLDDLSLQAASDALLAVDRKLPEFRGASRFTTWACKFALFEISVRLRRRAWTARRVTLEDFEWEQLSAPAGDVAASLDEKELLAGVRQAVDTTLTDHQRQVFLAAVVEEIPIDVIAERQQSTRGAVYKTLHDARRRLRAALVAAGHLEVEA
jgi:RNA polymerase sigma-70 factor (ECF subfamily)